MRRSLVAHVGEEHVGVGSRLRQLIRHRVAAGRRPRTAVRLARERRPGPSSTHVGRDPRRPAIGDLTDAQRHVRRWIPRYEALDFHRMTPRASHELLLTGLEMTRDGSIVGQVVDREPELTATLESLDPAMTVPRSFVGVGRDGEGGSSPSRTTAPLSAVSNRTSSTP